jgi:hypothetical protein
MAQVVKIKDDVKPGIDHPPPVGLCTNILPITCDIAIQVTAVIAAPKTDRKKVDLLASTKGPDQNAIPVKIEL